MADEEVKGAPADAQLPGDATDAPATEKSTQPTLEEDDEGEEEEGEEEQAGADGAASSGKKKKRKPRKKKKKPADDNAVATSSSSATSMLQNNVVPVHDIPSLLQQLALSAPNKKEGKAQDEYKFWNTQPVPKFKEPNLLQTTAGANGESLPEGAIVPNEVCAANVKSEPEALIEPFEWCEIDLDNAEELQEFYDLLYNHYVEDTEGSFRFNYSTKFLSWALKPPGWRKEWHIGVRTKSGAEGKKGKLVASIAGIPVTLKVRDHTLKASEINFLAIHRKLRNKRLAPILIKEVTRRCNQHGIFQALYTAGTLLPTPVSTCRYFHRSLDWEHLYDTGFSHMPPRSSVLRQKLKYKLDTQTSIKGLRLMKPADIPAVRDLLTRYTARFHLRQDFSVEEITHWLCSDVSKGVVWSYVVEDKGKITDFISYYLLESTVLRSQQKATIRAAYLFYYATESAFPSNSAAKPKASALQEALQTRLRVVVHDALILAKKDDFHVFNALTLLDNPLFLADQKFEPGDGKLHYYLFNWRTPKLPGGINEGNAVDPGKMGGVGVVML